MKFTQTYKQGRIMHESGKCDDISRKLKNIVLCTCETRPTCM